MCRDGTKFFKIIFVHKIVKCKFHPTTGHEGTDGE